ncbi:tRNA (guanosine(37)-N1)-methyltransferase TrmD [Xylanivirga thermophila]|uniref:tRNA (guanosine(37)-N1)-methyltransferase TrmD n=1 Tax=Xylanivirga thermophila TaxID=2496273 RepID=UPI00101C0BC1|nr:tRNA (guanosine(37)-N1)-methyltransferase TrmD [Xylanivirga thermophila]
MVFDVLTLFPEMFGSVLNTSILGRAIKKGLIKVNLYNIRDFAKNKHKRVDDYPYGGGCGMVMMPQPLFDAFYYIAQLNGGTLPTVIYFSPQGTTFNQKIATDFSKADHLVLLCGHYEGIDQRIIDNFVDVEISIGDYVLTGGELPAMIFIDSVSRFVSGVLGDEQSAREESFSNGLLEYPQYTRPYDYQGHKVPEILLSGNHKEINKWRKLHSLNNTLIKRPDLLKNTELSAEDKQMMRILKQRT